MNYHLIHEKKKLYSYENILLKDLLTTIKTWNNYKKIFTDLKKLKITLCIEKLPETATWRTKKIRDTWKKFLYKVAKPYVTWPNCTTTQHFSTYITSSPEALRIQAKNKLFLRHLIRNAALKLIANMQVLKQTLLKLIPPAFHCVSRIKRGNCPSFKPKHVTYYIF